MKQGVYLRAMAADATEAVVDIIGVIGWSVAYTELRDMLRGIPASIKRVVFDIYSPGGDVWEGNGIVSEIGELNKRVETVAKVQVAASMATLIAVACQKRTMASNGRFLIHNAWTATVGDATAHEKAAQTLRDCETEAAKFYGERTGQSVESMTKLMGEERWLLPEEAKRLGFVQEISDPFKEDDYMEVKQAIVAAGKWPKALVEISATESKEEKKDDNPANADTEKSAPVGAPVEQAPANVEYERGLADGKAEGKSAATRDLAPELEGLKKALTDSEKLASKYQSERDKLQSQLDQERKNSDERAMKLQAELDKASEMLRKHIAGAVTFEPAIETWEAAMTACGGDYAKAAKKYPEQLKQYRVRKDAERNK